MILVQQFPSLWRNRSLLADLYELYHSMDCQDMRVRGTRADPGFVLLCKWRSRISFLCNVKQAKKRLRDVLIQPSNLCIFRRGLWCAKFPMITPVKLLLWSMSLGGDCWSIKAFRVWIPCFEASNLRTFVKVFLEKISLPEFLITIVCDSPTLIFFNIIPAFKNTATYIAAW